MTKSKVYKPLNKQQRRYDIREIAKLDKYIARKPYPPGQHGNKRRLKLSDYAFQLREKQRAKFIYGLRDKQFTKIYTQASKAPLNTGERLLQLLELRLDNVIFRSGIVNSRRHARQLTNHGHIKVNDKNVNIPSFVLKKDDEITIKNPEKYKISKQDKNNWIKVDPKSLKIKVQKVPSRAEIPTEIEEQLIIEYFSR